MTKIEKKSRKPNPNRGAKPGERRGGRKKGTPNKTTGMLKEAILAAAEKVGFDGKGMDGLEGYLAALAMEEKRAFAGLLGKVLPMQLQGDATAPLVVKIIRGLGEE
jgi:hypothetical protein